MPEASGGATLVERGEVEVEDEEEMARKEAERSDVPRRTRARKGPPLRRRGGPPTTTPRHMRFTKSPAQPQKLKADEEEVVRPVAIPIATENMVHSIQQSGPRATRPAVSALRDAPSIPPAGSFDVGSHDDVTTTALLLY